jgi:hypothetical protein
LAKAEEPRLVSSSPEKSKASQSWTKVIAAPIAPVEPPVLLLLVVPLLLLELLPLELELLELLELELELLELLELELELLALDFPPELLPLAVPSPVDDVFPVEPPEDEGPEELEWVEEPVVLPPEVLRPVEVEVEAEVEVEVEVEVELELLVTAPLDDDDDVPLEPPSRLVPTGSHTPATQLHPLGQKPPAPQALPVTSTTAEGLHPAAAKIANPSRREAFMRKA